MVKQLDKIFKTNIRICTPWTLSKHMERKVDGSCTIMSASCIKKVVEGSIPQSNSKTDTYHLSRKQYKLDEQDRGTLLEK